MELNGKHVVIVAQDRYEDMELWYPKLRLREAGAEVTVVGAGNEVFYSEHGYPVKTDARLDQVHLVDYDAVIIPGSDASHYMKRNEALIDFVREAAREGKTVAATCHGSAVLASAGILQNKRVTGSPDSMDDLVRAGARYSHSSVVRDGNVITSRLPDDLPELCREIIHALEPEEEKEEVDPHPITDNPAQEGSVAENLANYFHTFEQGVD
jgi:protease I